MMIFKIQRFLGSLSYSGEEGRQQARLLRFILSVAISLTLAISVAVAFFVEQRLESFVILAILLVAEFILLIITHFKMVRLASFLITIGLGVILLYVTCFFGGVREVTYSAFVIVILSGGLLLGKRYVWITTLVGILGGLLILILEMNNLLTGVNLLPDPPITWAANAGMFVWSAAILYVTLQDKDTAFLRVQEEARASQEAYDTTLAGWSRALELRDHETEGHSRRVVEHTVQLALAMGLQSEAIIHLKRGALLHDIGKMGIPDSILGKPGPLADEEWLVMRQHPLLAYQLLQHIEYLRFALDIPYCHHEKWDGSGYPRGLKGENIPLAARIFSVVDVWDALLSDRPYRKGCSREEALAYIRGHAGTHFDPRIARVFLEIVERKDIQAQ
ncbi:MAG: HD domain-containing phosphohydrolase [Anaerolineales bacterium]